MQCNIGYHLEIEYRMAFHVCYAGDQQNKPTYESNQRPNGIVNSLGVV